MHKNIREATHANSWYSGHAQALEAELSGYINSAQKQDNFNNLKSIIVPHAGYAYCAPTAAYAFVNINPSNYNRVVLLGPSHHEYFPGCGMTPFEYFQTPFGDIKVDTETNKKLLENGKYFNVLPEEVDKEEHSLELEMPFLKMLFKNKDLSILPIMVGDTNLKDNYAIANELYNLYEDPKTLFLVSSDFCHWGKRFGYTYYDKESPTIWESTEKLDKKALEIIGKLDPAELDKYFKTTRNTICGRNPIGIVLCTIDEYKKKHKDANITFDCAKYSQSEKVKSANGSSVSYAAGVNFIN